MQRNIPVILVILFLLLFFSFQEAFCMVMPDSKFRHRPAGDALVYDYANLIDDKSEERINGLLRRLSKDADIEFFAVSVDSLKGENIDSWTNELFQNWKIGSLTKGQKGMLFVVSAQEKQVRMEAGYDLEQILTDGFIGYVENEQMKPFFEQGRIGVGFEATLELIAGRIWEKVNAGAYAPDAGPGKTDNFSGGAGAKKTFR